MSTHEVLDSRSEDRGTNVEVMPGQKESDRPVHRTPDGRSPHDGPVHHVSREQVSWLRCFHQPKAYRGNWSSAGCHTIFSTKLMREKGGFDVMIKVCEAFDKVAADT